MGFTVTDDGIEQAAAFLEDVRFLHERSRGWYLSINSRRGVIECPISGMLNINGWDIKKALGLLLEADPVLLEWLRSPTLYRKVRAST